jgi:hypothetical protein
MPNFFNAATLYTISLGANRIRGQIRTAWLPPVLQMLDLNRNQLSGEAFRQLVTRHFFTAFPAQARTEWARRLPLVGGNQAGHVTCLSIFLWIPAPAFPSAAVNPHHVIWAGLPCKLQESLETYPS